MKFSWSDVGQFIIENGTYKLVALFITLSLWVFIFERQISIYTKNVKLDYLLAPHHYIVNKKVIREVQFKVKGPRMAVKRFMEASDSINVDISNSGPGATMVRIYDDILDLPSNVSVVSVQPSNIYLEIGRRDPETGEPETTLIQEKKPLEKAKEKAKEKAHEKVQERASDQVSDSGSQSPSPNQE